MMRELLDTEALDLVVGVGDVAHHVINVALGDSCTDESGLEVFPQAVDPSFVSAIFVLLVKSRLVVEVVDLFVDVFVDFLRTDAAWDFAGCVSDQW
jgi:hypothetical protein